MWEGKVTEELKELYVKYAELFDGTYPDECDDICYDVDYDEFVECIKKCIEKKKEILTLLREEREEKQKKAFNLLKELYLQYVSVFGELPENYKEIEGYQDLSDEKKKEAEHISSEEQIQYVERAIKHKEKDTISDCIVFIFRELILEVALGKNW